VTQRSTYRLPQRPSALQGAPAGLPFWGERRPPKNYADVFRASAAVEPASDDSTGTRTVATLRLYGPIYDGWFGVSARAVGKALDELGDVDEVRVRINSPGGDAWEGMAILNMLRAHAADVTAVVDGVAASAASYLAAGCDRTVMSPGTQMMIHDASAFAYGPAEIMLKAATFLDSVSDSIASIYADVAGGTDEEWRALMRETTWYTAKEAVASGLADEVAVVRDDGDTETAETEEPSLGESDVEDHWDLSMYPYAGRSHAPAPPMPPSASAVGSPPTQEGSPAVAFSDEQVTTMRQQLGVAENADEATILAALDEALTERTDPPAAESTPTIPEGHVVIPQAALADLQANAQAGARAAETLRVQDRSRFLDGHRDRFLPSSRAAYERQYDVDPDGTREYLANAAVIVPLAELGHADESTASENVTESEAYQNWSM
jgi:ATP-dependent protease ClpP protease subunit